MGHWQARLQPRSHSKDGTRQTRHGIGNRLRNRRQRNLAGATRLPGGGRRFLGDCHRKAREKAEKAHAPCAFVVLDILQSHVAGAPFGFAFDRGCFHVVGSGEERTTFAKQVHRHLENGGLWLSLIGNADEERVGEGPPRRTAGEIVNAVEPFFEILSLESGHFEANLSYPPRAWVCLMRKRPVP